MKSDNYNNSNDFYKGKPIRLNIKEESKANFLDEIEEAIKENNVSAKKTPKRESKPPKEKKKPKKNPVKVKTSKAKPVKVKKEKPVKNKPEKKKFSIMPDSLWLGIAMIAAGFAGVLFLGFVIALDVLPLKYLLLVIFVLLAIDALIVYLATSPSKHGTRRIGALVIIFVVLIATLTGDYYIYSTNDTLTKISQQRDTWEYYDVLVSNDSTYEKVGDIKGKTVYVTDMESKQLKEAKERLVTKADVTYIKEPNFVTVGEHLIPGEVKAEDVSAVEDAATVSDDVSASEATSTSVSESNSLSDTDVDENSDETSENIPYDKAIALVSESQYKILKSNVKGFKKNTKCIYKMKVKKRANDSSKAVDVTKDSFNVLISGLDSWGTIDQGGLSDVNMVMTVNPTTREILLTSIPRDSYIPLHTSGQKDKLTHSGIYGEEETKATIEDFLDIDINYTVRVNFSMLVHLIHEINGIDVYSEYDFDSSISDHFYKKGWNHLYGMGSLYFARERKAFTDGDMQRNKHQQVVLEAVIKKITSSKVLLTSYTKILNVVEKEMATDMKDSDLKKLAKMQLNDMRGWKIKKVNIVGSTGGAPCYSMGGQQLSCVFPSEESVNKAKKAIHDTMYPADIKDEEETAEGTEESTEE